MNAPDVAYQVERQFTALRKQFRLVKLGTLLCVTVSLLLAVWLAVSIADYTWELSRQWRLSLLVGLGLAVVSMMSWQTWTAFRSTGQRSFASFLERSFEDFGQRIRTVLDTARGRVDGPQEMLMALGNQTLGRWELIAPHQLIPTRWLAASAAVMGLVGMIVSLCFLSGGDVRTSMLRSIGSEIPYTRLEVHPGDKRVLEGSVIELSMDLLGRTNRDVTLRYRELRDDEEPTWAEMELLPQVAKAEAGEGESESTTRKASYSTSLGKAVWPVEYQFSASEHSSPIYRIDIQQLIKTERIESQVTAPEYTGLKPRLFSKPDLAVLERSDVQVTIELNHPLREAKLEVGEKLNKLVAVDLQATDDRSLWKFQLPSTKTLRWRFSGFGNDGTPMDPVVGRLTIRRDAEPTMRWREPSDEIRVHTLAELPLSVQVSDDFGITETGIVFLLGGEEEYVLTQWIKPEETESADVVQNQTRMLLTETLPLESFGLTERDFVAYFAYAIDNRPWGQRRTESDVRYIDIRPLRQFYQEIDPPGGGNGGGGRVIVQLSEIIRRERFLYNRTRGLIRQQSDMASQLGSIDRMVKNQSELADLTRFLAEFFVQRGNDDVEALSQAEAAMLQASDSLAAGALDLALAQEQEALLSLAEARNTLQQLLFSRRMTNAQQQQLRRLARQLRQKLRRKPLESAQELSDSLKRIAAEQRRLSGELARASEMNSKSQAASGKPGSGKPKDDSESMQAEDIASNEDSESDPSQPRDSEIASAESPDADQAKEDEETSEPDPTEQWYEKQVDLLDRLEGVGDELSTQLSDSPLLSDRMSEAQDAMDSIATQIRAEGLANASSSSRSLADLLGEMASQIEALGAAEPVARVASMRDLTSGMSSLENLLSESIGVDPGGQREAAERSTRQIAERMDLRAQTLREVLSAQAGIGDIEMSEVNERLNQFASENEFLDQLTESREAAEQLVQEKPEVSDQASTEAYQRAIGYLDAARQLDQLYQQLVTPRLARLRRMEKRANSLSKQLSGSGGGGEKRKQAEAGVRELEKELKEEKLNGLADMLRELDSDEEQLDSEEMLQDRMNRNNGSGTPQAYVDRTLQGRVRLVAEELRKRIQQVILLEIAVDRNAPVPTKYQRAVDGYFRTLATEDTAGTVESDTVDSSRMDAMTGAAP